MSRLNMYWVLRGHEVVPTEDFMAWGKMFEDHDARRVARTEKDGWLVSTVFLGMDHGFGDGPPLLFETMAFDEKGEEFDMTRCSTWAEAEQHHKTMCEKIFGHAPPTAKHRVFLED